MLATILFLRQRIIYLQITNTTRTNCWLKMTAERNWSNLLPTNILHCMGLLNFEKEYTKEINYESNKVTDIVRIGLSCLEIHKYA